VYDIDRVGSAMTEREVPWESRVLPLEPSTIAGSYVRAEFAGAVREAATGSQHHSDPVVDKASFRVFTEVAVAHNIDPAIVERIAAARAAVHV
jgi:hypothetical protein